MARSSWFVDTHLHEATQLLHGEISSYQMDTCYYAKDGHLIWIHLSGSMIRDAEGQALHFIAHMRTSPLVNATKNCSGSCQLAIL